MPPPRPSDRRVGFAQDVDRQGAPAPGRSGKGRDTDAPNVPTIHLTPPSEYRPRARATRLCSSNQADPISDNDADVDTSSASGASGRGSRNDDSSNPPDGDGDGDGTVSPASLRSESRPGSPGPKRRDAGLYLVDLARGRGLNFENDERSAAVIRTGEEEDEADDLEVC